MPPLLMGHRAEVDGRRCHRKRPYTPPPSFGPAPPRSWSQTKRESAAGGSRKRIEMVSFHRGLRLLRTTWMRCAASQRREGDDRGGTREPCVSVGARRRPWRTLVTWRCPAQRASTNGSEAPVMSALLSPAAEITTSCDGDRARSEWRSVADQVKGQVKSSGGGGNQWRDQGEVTSSTHSAGGGGASAKGTSPKCNSRTPPRSSNAACTAGAPRHSPSGASAPSAALSAAPSAVAHRRMRWSAPTDTTSWSGCRSPRLLRRRIPASCLRSSPLGMSACWSESPCTS